MSASLSNTLAIMQRALRQLRHDPRFVAISLVMPMIICYLLSLFFEGVNSPIVDPKRFVVPVGAFIVHFITYALCAIVLVRERRGGTLERMFISGYGRAEVVGGYLLAYSLLATAQSLIVLVGLNALFDLGYTFGIFTAIFGFIWLLAVMSIALGMLVSNFARNEGQVFPMIPLVIMISVFFSGILLPIDRLPEGVQFMRFVTPMYYANVGLQELIDTRGSVDTMLVGLVGLVIYGLALLGLATLTLREQD